MITLNTKPTEYLDVQWLNSDGTIKLQPASVYHAVPQIDLILWCYRHARYVVPTVELVEFLKAEIGTRTAIELGAGNSDLAYHLGITATDSYIQQVGHLKQYYESIGQAPTNPPAYVEKLDAIEAIYKYYPKVAVASWLTRLFEPQHDVEGMAQASIYGVKEERILDAVETYIHIGNARVHGTKTVLKLPHKEIKLPGLVSRSQHPEDDIIYIWSSASTT